MLGTVYLVGLLCQNGKNSILGTLEALFSLKKRDPPIKGRPLKKISPNIFGSEITIIF
jgi:hypothetical protein